MCDERSEVGRRQQHTGHKVVPPDNGGDKDIIKEMEKVDKGKGKGHSFKWNPSLTT
jgi:hypothetical protein